MGLFDSIIGGPKIKAANKKVLEARGSETVQAEKLFSEAMTVYASIKPDSSVFKDALYNWGLALLYSARLKSGEEAKLMYEEAAKKFSYCLVAKPDYLAAALDWGVALMELAPLQAENERVETYALAKEKFELADGIHEGVASYNFACLHAINGDFEACKVALELARDYKNLPDDAEIITDTDMQVAKTQPWFNAFLESVHAPKEPEAVEQAEEVSTKGESTEYSKVKIKEDGFKVEYDAKKIKAEESNEINK